MRDLLKEAFERQLETRQDIAAGKNLLLGNLRDLTNRGESPSRACRRIDIPDQTDLGPI